MTEWGRDLKSATSGLSRKVKQARSFSTQPRSKRGGRGEQHMENLPGRQWTQTLDWALCRDTAVIILHLSSYPGVDNFHGCRQVSMGKAGVAPPELRDRQTM